MTLQTRTQAAAFCDQGADPWCTILPCFAACCAGVLACLDGYMNIAMEQTEVGRGAGWRSLGGSRVGGCVYALSAHTMHHGEFASCVDNVTGQRRLVRQQVAGFLKTW